MRSVASVAALLLLGAAPLPAAPFPAEELSAQSVLERTPNVEGIWGGRPGTLHFHFLHRFQVSDPPFSKVSNTPTFLLGAGLPGRVLAGLRYATSSALVPATPNEWEVFARWAALPPGSGAPLDLAVQGGWNGTAESADGEIVAGRELGPVLLRAGVRGFSAFRGEEGRAGWLAGGLLRLHRFVAVAGDAAQVLGEDAPDLAWSAGLQLAVPYTPHTLSLHVSNANTTTLQGSTIGFDRRLWGFEFTIPLTLSRYFGSGGSAAAAVDNPATTDLVAPRGSTTTTPAAPAAVVEMNNRLQFLPDTVRIRAGETVVWRNTSALIHTVTADPERAARAENVALPAGATAFDSGDIVPGAEFSYRFEVAGEYRYVCLPHELAEMFGTVIVEP